VVYRAAAWRSDDRIGIVGNTPKALSAIQMDSTNAKTLAPSFSCARTTMSLD
jgi:hypothetical protein